MDKDTHKAHVTIDPAKCIPCSGLMCVGTCPQGVLEEGKNKKPQVTTNESCTLCGVCVDLCPAKAITINNKPKIESR